MIKNINSNHVQNTFSHQNLESLKRVVGQAKILIIDEAQRIDNIGLTLKLLIDNFPMNIIASGSASFELADKINEPLTGRTKTFWLYPLSCQEIQEKNLLMPKTSFLEKCLRKEINKTSKYYFTDVGVRNALIRNFNSLHLRNDAGALFENWFIMEKIKLAYNNQWPANFYFWRTYDQQKIDLIEERSGKLIGYECKWSAKKKTAPPKDWGAAYQNALFQPINPENFIAYLT